MSRLYLAVRTQVEMPLMSTDAIGATWYTWVVHNYTGKSHSGDNADLHAGQRCCIMPRFTVNVKRVLCKYNPFSQGLKGMEVNMRSSIGRLTLIGLAVWLVACTASEATPPASQPPQATLAPTVPTARAAQPTVAPGPTAQPVASPTSTAQPAATSAGDVKLDVQVFVRNLDTPWAIDFAPDAVDVAEALINETLRDPGAVEIGYHHSQRFAVGLE